MSIDVSPVSSKLSLQKDQNGSATLAEDLVRVGHRDWKAFRRVYDATSGQLLGICTRVSGNRETGEDVLQNVFIKVWAHAGDYDPERARPITWLATIARNSAIDAYRSQARRKTEPVDQAFSIADGCKLIDAELIDRQEIGLAMDLIDGLDLQLSEHVRDLFFDGLTYSELSERDGIPPGTIKSRIHRALKLLRARHINLAV